jgi:hypothetical protein
MLVEPHHLLAEPGNYVPAGAPGPLPCCLKLQRCAGCGVCCWAAAGLLPSHALT